MDTLERSDLEQFNEVLSEWKQRLFDFSEKIRTLSASTDDQFLQIGSNLQDFYTRSENMSNLSSMVLELLAGEKIANAIDGLHRLLNRVNIQLEQAGSDSTAHTVKLIEIKDTIKTLLSPLDSLKRDGMILGMMGVSVKIESSRLGGIGRGFSNLAVDIKKLSNHLDIKSSDISQHLEALSAILMSTIRKVEELDDARGGKMARIVRQTQSTIEIMRNLKDSSSTTANTISENSNLVHSHIGEVVVSIQFQDITRQQMEHVMEAMTALINKIKSLETRSDEESDKTRKKIVRLVGDVCELQHAQLINSMNELSKAVLSIIDSLEGIEQLIKLMTEETGKMTGDKNIQDSTILQNIEKGISTVASILDETKKTEMEVSKTVNRTLDRISKVSLFIDDIEFTTSNIELTALNARVKAAHTKGKGATLDVLAGAIHQQSLTSRHYTNVISDILSGIRSNAEGFETVVDSSINEADHEIHEIAEELSEYIESIRIIEDQVSVAVNDLREATQSLAEDIQNTISSITVHRMVAGELDTFLDDLMEITNLSRELVPEDIEIDSEELESLKLLYTMETERMIHNKKDQAETFSLSNVDIFGDPPPGGEDEFGDNVELF